jgi:hypothetical protein
MTAPLPLPGLQRTLVPYPIGPARNLSLAAWATTAPLTAWRTARESDK